MRKGDGERQEDNLMEMVTCFVVSTHVLLDASRGYVINTQESASVNLVTMVQDVRINATVDVSLIVT